MTRKDLEARIAQRKQEAQNALGLLADAQTQLERINGAIIELKELLDSMPPDPPPPAPEENPTPDTKKG